MLIERVTPLRGETNDSSKAYYMYARGGSCHNLSSISTRAKSSCRANVLAALARLNPLNPEARTKTVLYRIV